MAEKELPMLLRDDNLSEETKKLISSLPTDKDAQGKLCKYQGCWYYYNTLQAVINFQENFQPQDTDIILASFPKAGTTWLKALSVALLERSKHDHDDPLNHPLLSDNPHGIVPFLEFDMYLKGSTPDQTKFPLSSPRLFSTHMPLHTIKENLKDSPCKIVYLCRNAKDALISRWFYRCKYQNKDAARSILESMFESFCSGVGFYGPIWDHALSYWKGSLENPKNVLFMRYEELKTEPSAQLKRLAEFLGCPFTEEEEENGLVEKILELCSLDNLSGLEVNKTGKTWTNVDYKSYFRKGEVGDWKNYLTPEMETKIDMIIDEKLKGSGLTF
ncbi:Cytosolic sulfotransferase 1 [Raphanus sativus]|uniref:Sulfotransferase n=1 Tax=Raphanus sativus TaxID=3726 RepID=A0A6J0LQ08_RAPSA|nr:cytosolic sulfotransferase 1-like [Raphanus sativus]KAJ4883387.1 Cytosolic sulfotransferase 1 [Raphanus sativus]